MTNSLSPASPLAMQAGQSRQEEHPKEGQEKSAGLHTMEKTMKNLTSYLND